MNLAGTKRPYTASFNSLNGGNSQAFLSQLKAVLLGRAGVGSASE